MTSLGLGDNVNAIDQPVALTTFYVLVSKAQPYVTHDPLLHE
jgi:hypothetical protein